MSDLRDIATLCKEIDCLTAQVDALRIERDYARREVCWIFTERSDEPTRIKAQSVATDRGWDCFKEEQP